MPRYFIDVSYLGTNYSGFQSQHNANTIQREIERALFVLSKEKIVLTGSSRTDTGVHALQNFFHFDCTERVEEWKGMTSLAQLAYKLNALTPVDIAVKKVIAVSDDAHCRFDAINRKYKYYIYRRKDPFLFDRAYYFPYRLDEEKMQQAAKLLLSYTDFSSFSKRNTQVKSFNCKISESQWFWEDDCLVYQVTANRFLRGMVRGLVATLLLTGRNRISVNDFKYIIESRDSTRANFAVPGKGLYLVAVTYPPAIFEQA